MQNAIENDDPFEVLRELSEKDDSLEMQDTTMEVLISLIYHVASHQIIYHKAGMC